MRAALAGLICLAPALAACASFPPIREAPTTQAAWPTLMPIDEVLAGVPPPPPADPALAVTARAAALRARAAELRQAGPAG